MTNCFFFFFRGSEFHWLKDSSAHTTIKIRSHENESPWKTKMGASVCEQHALLNNSFVLTLLPIHLINLSRINSEAPSSFPLSVVHRLLNIGTSKGVPVIRVRAYVKGVKLSTGRGFFQTEAKEDAARGALGYIESNSDRLKSVLLPWIV